MPAVTRHLSLIPLLTLCCLAAAPPARADESKPAAAATPSEQAAPVAGAPGTTPPPATSPTPAAAEGEKPAPIWDRPTPGFHNPYATPTRSPRFIFPTLHVMLGPLFPLGTQDANGLSIHVQGGAFIGWPGRNPLERAFVGSLWILPELSYDHRRFDPIPGQVEPPNFDHREGHLMSAGVGVGYGNLMFVNGLYHVRFVVGSVANGIVDGQPAASTAVGFRHGISGHFLATLFSVNLEHQILSYGDTVRHDLLFTVGLNLTVPFLAFLL